MDMSTSSDDDDVRLFEPLGIDLARRLIRIKHNDPRVTTLRVKWHSGLNLNGGAWTRLGCIVGQSTGLREIHLRVPGNQDIANLCEGLKNNQCITSVNIHALDTEGTRPMISVAPVLYYSTCLKKIHLENCIHGTSSVNMLANALMNRSEDSIEEISLFGNIGVDVDLDKFTLALSQFKKLKTLVFGATELGQRGCSSLAKLLKNQGSNLESLYLYENHLSDESAIILANALASNTNLTTLGLFGESDIAGNITSIGWSALLRLVCDYSGINDVLRSNNTCDIIYLYCDGAQNDLDGILGANDANLLRASGSINRTLQKTKKIERQKLIWSHAKGELNLGYSPLDTVLMPHILAWFLHEDNTSLVQYHYPPLPDEKILSVQLDSAYRILRSRPDLLKG